MRFIRTLFTLVSLGLMTDTAPAAGKAERVVVIVWDGMRPDFVTETNTPALFQLARTGVTFKNHHPVYLSTTEVNGTALATGVYPALSGIIGNREYRPAINATKAVSTEALATVRAGDELTGGRYLAFPTVAEILQSHGRRTVIAGAKPVALLHDRAARTNDAVGVNLFAGSVLPPALSNQITAALGDFPALAMTKTNRDVWTAKALIGPLWEKEVPVFSLLWLSEPDYSQHRTGPGSALSLAALRASDDNLARVLAALDERKLRDSTDVIIVSDHAFSTVHQVADIAAALGAQGLPVLKEFPVTGAQTGDVLLVGLGGAVFFYVTGHDPARIESVVRALQAQPFCGVVFTRKPLAGTFPLREARIDSPDAPDIAVALRWLPGQSTNGTPGLIYSESGEKGMHGTLSPFDMHNTCIAAGPDFRPGIESHLPSGNVDIAPTILWIFGIEPKQKMSGRVLREAMLPVEATTVTFEPHHLEASWRGEKFTWHQYLNYSEVNGVIYLDEGNGRQIPLAPEAGK